MASQTQTTAVPLPEKLQDTGEAWTQEAEAAFAEHRAEQGAEKVKQTQAQARVVERQRKRVGTTQLEGEAAKTAVKEGARQRNTAHEDIDDYTESEHIYEYIAYEDNFEHIAEGQ